MADTEQTTAEETTQETTEETSQETTQETTEQGSLLSGDTTEQQAESIDYAAVEMPEGQQLDPELLTAYGPMLQESGVSAEQAGKLFPAVNEIIQKRDEAQIAAFQEQQTADRDLIGKMTPESMADAKTGMEKIFGEDPDAMAALSGRYGDLPWLVKGLAKIGGMMSGDSFIEGGNAGAGKSEPDKVLYPSMHT